MKNKTTVKVFTALAFTAILIFAGCAEEGEPSLDSLIGGNVPVPTITGVAPSLEAYSGVTDITISGTNFSANSAENFVYFGAARATILSASTTQLVIKAPVVTIPADSGFVEDTLKVTTLKSPGYSLPVKYRLKAAVEEIATDRKTNNRWWGICTDQLGNIYAQMTEKKSDKNLGIKKIDAGNIINDYAPNQAGLFVSLKMGPSGILYGTRGVRALFQIEAGQASKTFATVPAGILTDLDFDKNLNIWTSGTAMNSLYSMKPDKTVKGFPFTGEVSAIRVYDDYLYVAAKRDGAGKIFRFPIISADQLGAEEIYFDFDAQFTTFPPEIKGINLADDGTLFIANDGEYPVYMIAVDKSFSPLYPDLTAGIIFTPEAQNITWGISDEMYFVKKSSDDDGDYREIIKVYTGKQSAPYYGRGDL